MIEALAGAALAIGTGSGRLPVTGVFAIVALIGAARAFESPTLSALMPGLVPQNQLQQASAWSASANQTATIVGPALGGLLYAAGDFVPFSLATVMFVAASVFVSCIRLERPLPPREAPTLRSVFGGIDFIRSNPAVLGAISLDLFAVLLGGATALLPIYAHDILHTGSWGLGILRAAPAVGALAMSFFLVRRPLKRHAGHIMFGAVIGSG